MSIQSSRPYLWSVINLLETFLDKKVLHIYHSVELGFDAELPKKILNCTNTYLLQLFLPYFFPLQRRKAMNEVSSRSRISFGCIQLAKGLMRNYLKNSWIVSNTYLLLLFLPYFFPLQRRKAMNEVAGRSRISFGAQSFPELWDCVQEWNLRECKHKKQKSRKSSAYFVLWEEAAHWFWNDLKSAKNKVKISRIFLESLSIFG